MQKKKGEFYPNVLYFTDVLVQKYFDMGKEHVYALYTILRKTYSSEHFNNFDKPDWYDKKQQAFRRNVREMVELGLARYEGGGYTLTSLKKNSGVQGHIFNPPCVIMVDRNIDKLIELWQDRLVRRNYEEQVRRIVLQEIGCTYNDLKVSKSKRTMFRKLYRGYIDSKRAFKLVRFSCKNRTALSCEGAGELFNRSKYYGWAVMKRLIKQGKVERRIYMTKLLYIQYNKATLPNLIARLAEYGIRFIKGIFYKIETAFVWIEHIETKELLSIISKRNTMNKSMPQCKIQDT